jgi:transglycosylase-like protein with SLT domain
MFGSNEARPRTDGVRLQLAQKGREHEESQEEQRTRAEELRQQQAGLKNVAGGRSGMSKERAGARAAQLQAKERTGLLERPPASSSGGGGAGMRERKLEIAREDIVAQPVAPASYARYVQIYKTAAKRYGFAKNCYVLAAVGKVESNHRKNMGPSGAGAMGPMQFLPSTWKEYGVDGDAVPATAAYLKDGGEPRTGMRRSTPTTGRGSTFRRFCGQQRLTGGRLGMTRWSLRVGLISTPVLQIRAKNALRSRPQISGGAAWRLREPICSVNFSKETRTTR